MATREELLKALRNADAAGAADDAARLAKMINDMDGGAKPETKAAERRFDSPLMPNIMEDMLTTAVDGFTFGFGDKAIAGATSALTGDNYEDQLSMLRGDTQGARDRSGVPGMVSEAVGQAVPMVVTGGAAAPLVAATRLPRVLGMLGLAGAEGAGAGALDALGHDEEEVGTAALTGGAIGLTGGALGAGASKVIQGIAQKFKDVKIPSIDDLAKIKDDLYQQVEALGVKYTPKQMEGLVKDVVDRLSKAKANPRIHGETIAKSEELAKDYSTYGGNTPSRKYTSLEELDEFRQFANDDLGSATPQNRRMRQHFNKGIDEFVETAQPSKSGVTPQMASEGILAARGAAARHGKLSDIDEALDLAGDSPAQVRTAIKAFAKPKQRGRFDKEERKMIRDIRKPGGAEQTLETIGKFGGAAGVGLGTTIGSVGVIGGLDPQTAAYAAAIPLIGAFGRGGARRIQNNNIKRLRRKVAGVPPSFKLPDQDAQRMMELMTSLGLTAQDQ